MKLIDKLSCMTANRNALQDEILGLHQYINKLHARLNIKERFTTKPPNKVNPTSSKPCYYCSFYDGQPDAKHINFCVNCGRALNR